MSNFPSGDSHHSASQTHLSPLRASQSFALLPFVHAAPVVAAAQSGKGCPNMPAWHHLPLCVHCCWPLSSTVHCLRLRRCCHHKTGQGTGDMPRHHHPRCRRISSSRIVEHTAAVVAVARDSKERPTMPRHLCPHSHYLGSCAHCCMAAVVAANRKGQGMANNAKALLSALLPFVCAAPLSLSREQARDGRQWQQGTIFHLLLLSSCTIIHAAHPVIKQSSC
jgi:hypothetical protein